MYIFDNFRQNSDIFNIDIFFCVRVDLICVRVFILVNFIDIFKKSL